jgi:PAS domain S-box-containing protein
MSAIKFCKNIFCLVLIFITTICYADRIDSLVRKFNSASDQEKTSVLIDMSQCTINSNPQKAYDYANEALQNSINLKDLEGQAKSFFQIALCYNAQDLFGFSAVYLKKSLVIFIQIKKDEETANVYAELGNLSQKLGNPHRALKYYLLAIEIYKKYLISHPSDNKVIIQQSNSYLSIGIVYRFLNDLENSIDYKRKAIKIFEELKSEKDLARAFDHLGNTYNYFNNYNKALELFKKSIVIYQKHNFELELAGDLYNLGTIYEILRSFNEAETNYGKAIILFQKLKDERGKAHIYNHYGKINTIKQDYTKAKNYLNQALDISIRINDKTLIANAYQLLSELETKQQNYKKALELFQLFSIYKDSIDNETAKIRTSDIISSDNIDAQEKEIEALANSNKINESQLKRQKLVLYSILGGLIIVSAISLILFLQYRQKKNRTQFLAKQKGEITKMNTELRRVNAELSRNEEKFRLIVHNMPVLVIAFGKTGKIVFWNKECERVTGYKSKDIINNPDALTLLFPDDKLRIELQQDFSLKIDFKNFEGPITCKDNSQCLISWSSIAGSVPISGWSVWGIGVDITQRKLFERSLIQEKALLDSLINSVPDPIFYKDTQSRYIGVNKAFCEFYGIEAESIIGKTDLEVFEKEKAEMYMAIDQNILHKSHVHHSISWEKNAKGNKVLLDFIKIPFKDNNGLILGLVGIYRDITERYKFEEVLKNQKEHAEEADRLKTAFLANMAHEIRIPTNAIIGFTDLLAKSAFTQEQKKEYLNYISNSGKDLLHLIDDILDISKIEAGQIKITKTTCQVNEIISELKASYTVEKKLKGKEQILLQTSCGIEDEYFAIYSDPHRLKQILNNLISNALKYSEKGTIQFGYTIEANENITELKELLKFYVKDTGIGIAPEKHKDIFERFIRIEDKYVQSYSGTGLGLSISKTLVEHLGGKIWVESVVGEGTSFFFTIPYVKREAEIKSPEQNESLAKVSNWKDKTILIAEDDKMNFKLLEKALFKTQANILWAQDGMQAVELAKTHPEINVILMDIQMPKMNGYMATQEIKKFRKDTPVVAQTAFAMAGEKEKSLQMGCDNYITKPIMQKQLLEILGNYLNV